MQLFMYCPLKIYIDRSVSDKLSRRNIYLYTYNEAYINHEILANNSCFCVYIIFTFNLSNENLLYAFLLVFK